MDADEGRKVTAGLDLGANMGWAVVEGTELLACGVYRLKSKQMTERCGDMVHILLEYKLPQQCVHVGIEQPPYVRRKYVKNDGTVGEGGNLRTYGILNQYFGVACSVFVPAGVPVTGINVMTLKKWATGNGHAKKIDVIHAMARLSGESVLTTRPSDVSDAIACAYYVNQLVDPEYWETVKDWR